MLAAVVKDFKPFSSSSDYCKKRIIEIILHANSSGRFKCLNVLPNTTQRIIERDLWISPDAEVETFSGANMAIGTLALNADSVENEIDIIREVQNGISISVC